MITLPLKDGGILNSFMPGCGTKESISERCRMNRAAMVEQLQYNNDEEWPDDFVPSWPRVKQKLLDQTIYDGSDKLLRSGTHVPLAIVTAGPGQRSEQAEVERKLKREERRAKAKASQSMPRWRPFDGGSSDHAAVAARQPSASPWLISSPWQSSAASSAPNPQDNAADGRHSFAMNLVSPATKEAFWVTKDEIFAFPERRSQSCVRTRSLSRHDRGGGRTFNFHAPGRSASASSSSQTRRDQPWTGPDAHNWNRRSHLFSEGSNSTAEKMLDQQERREWENRGQR